MSENIEDGGYDDCILVSLKVEGKWDRIPCGQDGGHFGSKYVIICEQ